LSGDAFLTAHLFGQALAGAEFVDMRLPAHGACLSAFEGVILAMRARGGEGLHGGAGRITQAADPRLQRRWDQEGSDAVAYPAGTGDKGR
jgi:hypothetical protein